MFFRCSTKLCKLLYIKWIRLPGRLYTVENLPLIPISYRILSIGLLPLRSPMIISTSSPAITDSFMHLLKANIFSSLGWLLSNNTRRNLYKQTATIQLIHINHKFLLLRWFSTRFVNHVLQITSLQIFLFTSLAITPPPDQPYYLFHILSLLWQYFTIVIANLSVHNSSRLIYVNQGRICFCYQVKYLCAYRIISYGRMWAGE